MACSQPSATDRVAVRSGGVVTTLHADHLGSTVAAMRSGSTNSHKYRAFGARTRSSGDAYTDHLFTGQKQDETGLLYYNARYYDKLLGAFISPDPVIPGAENVFAYNRYLYGLANPLKYNGTQRPFPVHRHPSVVWRCVAGHRRYTPAAQSGTARIGTTWRLADRRKMSMILSLVVTGYDFIYFKKRLAS